MNLTNDRGEISIEVLPGDLRETMKVLKENTDLFFGQLIDIATVDYLQYGVSDWKTNDASGKGFSRATISSGVHKVNPHGVLQWYTICCL